MRVSYTLLTYWERGDIQGAINCYLHIPMAGSVAMEKGLRIHKEIENHIKEKKAFPEWFFKYSLKDPQTEKKIVVKYNELFDLVGVFDCLDDKTLFEFKTGNSSSLDWSRTDQIPLYFLIGELAEIEIEKAFLIRWNEKSDYTIIHNTRRIREKARNIVDSYAPEIYDYFKNEGLLNSTDQHYDSSPDLQTP